jgi:hypothetical protein
MPAKQSDQRWQRIDDLFQARGTTTVHGVQKNFSPRPGGAAVHPWLPRLRRRGHHLQ